MARNFTVALIELRARERGDKVNDTDVTSAEYMRLISASWARLYMKLVKAYPERFVATQDITTAGPSTAVDATFLSTVQVTWTRGTGDYVFLRSITMEEYPDYYRTGSTPEVYVVVGSSLVVLPSTTGKTLTHFYLPAPADLTAAATTINGEAGWEEYLVADVAGLVAIKCEEDPRPHFAVRDKLEQEIDKEVTLRDLRRSRTIRDKVGEEYNELDYRVGSWRDRLGW